MGDSRGQELVTIDITSYLLPLTSYPYYLSHLP